MRCVAALAIAAQFAAVAAAAQTQTVVDLEPRPGVTLRYVALAPDGPPKAAVMLLIGGGGMLNPPDRLPPNWQARGNFLSRSRELFRARGLFVAIPASPSDYKGPDGLGAYRADPDHARDLALVIADMRRRAPGAPVWLIGTSLGTVSAVNAAARLVGPDAADGLVLTSSITQPAPGRNAPPAARLTVYNLALGAIRLPTLVVAHSADSCHRTPPGDAARLSRAFSAAPRTALLTFEGGDPPQSEPCEALAAHGFFGIEKTVVDAMVDWLLAAR